MFGGIIEVVVGGVLIAIPDPFTSAAGAALVADGVMRLADEIEEEEANANSDSGSPKKKDDL